LALPAILLEGSLFDAVSEFVTDFTEGSAWKSFSERLHFVSGNFTKNEDYASLSKKLDQQNTVSDNRLYYLAVPPRFFPQIINQLGDASMVDQEQGWRRVVIEKPFGSDLESAQNLNKILHAQLSEDQIYRIDHYLGKETVQNVLVFRFANAIYEPVWNRNYIDHVQITVAEEVGVEHRAAYYDQVGVVRDMFQNHLFQLLTMVAMEPPATFQADALRNEKVKVLNAIRPISNEQLAEHTVRGQYQGYRDEEGVPDDSQTTTFAALRLFIDNWRWQDVPFYLRSGKRMAKKSTEILIQFRCPPHVMFPMSEDQGITPNILAICLQPDEGVHFRFEAKVPDSIAKIKSVDMDFHYADSFTNSVIPDAYERLLLDIIHGDASLFTRSDQIEMGWQLVDPIIRGWLDKDSPPLAFYEPGSWGPPEAEQLMSREGRQWLQVCGRH